MTNICPKKKHWFEGVGKEWLQKEVIMEIIPINCLKEVKPHEN
jgi:hypothetical protein